MNCATAACGASHPTRRSGRWTGLGDQVVANNKHVYPGLVHGLLISVHNENDAELRWTFELQSTVSFVEAGTKDIVDDMMLSLYLDKQSCSSYIRYMRLGGLMSNTFNAVPLFE